MPEKKITEKHRAFITQKVAEFTDSPSEIQALLADPEIAESYGFEPVKVSDVRICQIKQELDKDLLSYFRAQYLIEFISSDLKLAHKKERVRELIKLYESVSGLKKTDGKEISPSAKFDKKVKVLQHIRDEMGEDIDKIANALRDGRKVEITLSLGEKILSHYEAPEHDKDRAPIVKESFH